jgi:hypothetical protein
MCGKRAPRSDGRFWRYCYCNRHPQFPNYWRKVEDIRTFRQALEKFVKRVTIYSGKKRERKFRIDGVIDAELPISLNGESL